MYGNKWKCTLATTRKINFHNSKEKNRCTNSAQYTLRSNLFNRNTNTFNDKMTAQKLLQVSKMWKIKKEDRNNPNDSPQHTLYGCPQFYTNQCFLKHTNIDIWKISVSFPSRIFHMLANFPFLLLWPMKTNHPSYSDNH